MSTHAAGYVDGVAGAEASPGEAGPARLDPTLRAWVEVDRQALRQNARAMVELVRPAALMAVVKADGYGHGAVEVARAALEAGAAYLAVSCLGEALALRQAGIDAPVLVLGVGPAAMPAEAFARWDLTATLTTEEEARRLAEVARRAGRPVRVHLKVETGMGRLGVLPAQAPRLGALVASLEGLVLEGIYSHLATADEPDTTFLHRQAGAFREAVRAVEQAGVRPALRHLLNTAGLMAAPELRLDMVRVGLGLYGLFPAEHLAGRAHLEPALRLMARVVEVRRLPAGSPISYGSTYVTPRETRVATVAVGYADGFTRRLSGRARALVRGRLYPVVGRICMDQCMLDVGDSPVEVGDAACLLGPGRRGEMTVHEAAALTGTICYEVITQLGGRLPRVYV